MTRVTLEICVDDAAGIQAAAAGGADRIELCAALALGGLTPSAGLMALAAKVGIATMAMIRPRAGDFCWSEAEVEAMCAEIRASRAAGLAGVVIGASHADGRLDEAVLKRLMQEARGLDVTLHRAIDLTPDPEAAMRLVAALGIGRVLSSGGAQSASAGMARLQAMAAAAPDVSVMPGGGITAANAADFAAALPLKEIHASASSLAPAPALAAVQAFGFQPPGAKVTDREKVAALRQRLHQIAAAGGAGAGGGG
ncbi:copper homeostasis protein CutC [Xinfangfangia sp. D13-10-4-6]|uniref:copper homeostasis protein CutC n=1 Tax=Pseudogemmobacter hezensis TaxID=2737662 RepID=UPI001552F39B|nr:copper homeostasis protein CutC [Pseudogemmobacter hezensis]NPD16020.1 copper homeostasis protein CutC [Pseudogemmobacter hezensis]